MTLKVELKVLLCISSTGCRIVTLSLNVKLENFELNKLQVSTVKLEMNHFM